MSKLEFRTDFDPHHGEAVELVAGVRRITAPNSGPFTQHGTNTYIVGEEEVAVIDPGPEDGSPHYDAILRALKGRTVSHIVVTHTHVDHSPLARQLSRETGAPIYAEGPHRPARDLHLGELNVLDASGDKDFEPDVRLSHGDMINGKGFTLEAVFTPGHTANHMAFALTGTPYLFSGDHVMGWATSIVAPPDGSMADYMQSLETLLQRDETIYFPGHGGRLEKAREFVRGLRTHRRMRETAILQRLKAGDRVIPEIVRAIYRDTDPRLHGAAGLSVFAHLEDLVQAGKVLTQGAPSLDGEYTPADLPERDAE